MNTILNELLKTFSITEIENCGIKLLLNNLKISKIKNELVSERINNANDFVFKTIEKNFTIKNINDLDKFFEDLFNEKEKTENGIVFTPDFISDFIVEKTISDYNKNTVIMDPACGCGIFLVSAVKYIYKNFNNNIVHIIENNIYGIDIRPENIERVKILLAIFAITNNQDSKLINFNIKLADSLFSDWNKLFNINKIDYIIGNPPYVNNHDLNENYIEKLKNNFNTTQNGTFNIFYAFIEKSSKYLDSTSKLGFIIPNNFIHIKSAFELRKYVKDNKLLQCIIDLKDNTIFSPVLTYNCIIFLSRDNTQYFYSKISKKNNNSKILENIILKKNYVDTLDDNGWILAENNITDNIKKIERFSDKLEYYIKTGIATLKDKAYVLDGYDDNTKRYYKIVDNQYFYIDSDLISPYIKISKYKKPEDVGFIIFPYKIVGNRTIAIDEETLKERYSDTYKYFNYIKESLMLRDKGKKIDPFYLYGRSQGLTFFNKKIIFSTFSDKPNFTTCPNDQALLSNGYFITNLDFIEDRVLIKILNSSIMDYYVTHTSYSISGNYKCFQKKYIKGFSIPELSDDDIDYLLNHSDDDINSFLWNLYGLK